MTVITNDFALNPAKPRIAIVIFSKTTSKQILMYITAFEVNNSTE